jgi:Amt family ammonium transporter
LITPAAPLSESILALTFGLLMLAPLAVAGLVLTNVGLGRSRSAAQALLGNLAMAAVAVILFALVGSAFAGALPGGAGHILMLGGKPWSLAGTGPLFANGLATAPLQAQLTLLFEITAVALCVILPWGSGADRVGLMPGLAIAALLAVIFFPLAAHWNWGGGWLARLGANFGLGQGFLDAGGAATIHVLGGLAALSVVWIAGPRRGKFPKEGFSTAMPGHNAVYVLFGCLLALMGWQAFNAAGALLWMHLPLTVLPLTALNTVLSAAGAMGATFAVTRTRFGKPDASLCANGWMAGLVSSSATAAVVQPLAALFIGLVAGIATPLLVELFELALSIDDPSGAIGVHAISGLWGLLAAGIFSGGAGQFVAQLVGIAALLGFFLPLIYFVFLAVNRYLPFRVDSDGERMGLDLHELGGGAYPEFVMHRDESYR